MTMLTDIPIVDDNAHLIGRVCRQDGAWSGYVHYVDAKGSEHNVLVYAGRNAVDGGNFKDARKLVTKDYPNWVRVTQIPVWPKDVLAPCG